MLEPALAQLFAELKRRNERHTLNGYEQDLLRELSGLAQTGRLIAKHPQKDKPFSRHIGTRPGGFGGARRSIAAGISGMPAGGADLRVQVDLSGGRGGPETMHLCEFPNCPHKEA